MAAIIHSSIQITRSSLDELRRLLDSRSGQLFAILDACDEPRVPVKVQELGPKKAVSLYRGWAERDYWAIAPYLVQVDKTLLDWIFENLWDDPFGIFAVAQGDLDAVRKHFRRFLIVEDPNGKQLNFRFYDPRVLPVFLTTCTQAECKEFFGLIDAFYVNEVGQLNRLCPRLS